jgi:hypothetical protein
MRRNHSFFETTFLERERGNTSRFTNGESPGFASEDWIASL